MEIEFIKMQGTGNDYIYLDLLKHSYHLNFNDLALKISSRHFGVGGDGLVLITKGELGDFGMRMFNADGSEAEMCGNAIRCVGKYLFDRGYLKKKVFSIDTLAGVKNLWVIEIDGSGRAKRIKVDMGEPVLNGRDIPVNLDSNPVIGVEVMGYRGTVLSMGNPHVVIFLDEVTDEQVLGEGPKIENHPLFPRRTNVEFVRVIDRRHVKMRVWERGSGETLACGTGACASVVAGVLGNITDRVVDVDLPGGTLNIEWNEGNKRVYLTGPAEEVFCGVYPYNE